MTANWEQTDDASHAELCELEARIADVMLMVRRPWLWSLLHPVRAIRRAIK